MNNDPALAELLARLTRPATACPDCPATAHLVELGPDLHILEIGHDPTCPWFARYQQDKQAG